MATLDSAVGLIYTLKAEDAQARKTVSEFSDHVEKETGQAEGSFLSLGKSIGLTDKQIAALGQSAVPVLGAVAAGVGAIAAAGVATVGVMLDITRKTAEAGTEISRFSTLTGFSAETVGALKIAADGAGASLEEIEEVFESFVELMIEAGKGAEDAKEKVKSLGLDPQTAFQDLEGSFLKVLDKIREMPTQAGKADVAMKGMGESGLNMVKVADQMTGGTAAYIAKLKEMGVVMDKDGVQKSKEYDAQLKELDLQIKGITYTFGREWMPVFLDGARSISGWLRENQSEIKNWAQNSGDFLRGLAGDWRDLKNAANDYFSWYTESDFGQSAVGQKLPEMAEFTVSPFGYVGRKLVERTVRKGRAERLNNPKGSLEGDAGPDFSLGTDKDVLDKQKAAAEKAASDAKAAREKQLRLNIEGLDIDAQLARQSYEAFKKQIEDLLRSQAITMDDYQERLEKQIDEYIGKFASIQRQKRAELARLFSGKELENADKKLDAERQGVIDSTGADRLKTGLDKFQAEIKGKADSVKIQLELEKAKAAGELAENERLFASKERLESAYIKYREAVALRLLESEKKFTDEAIAEISKVIREQAEARGVSAENLLKENQIYNELFQRSVQLTSLITAQGKAAQAELARVRAGIIDELTRDESETEAQRLEIFRQNEREKYRILIEAGRNRRANMRGLLDFELDILKRDLEAEQQRQQAEKETYEKSVEGLENSEALKLQIQALYNQKKLLTEEEYQKRKSELERGYRQSVFDSTSQKYGGGFFGELAGSFAVMGDDTISQSEKMQGAIEGVAKSYDALKSIAGEAINSMVAGIQQLAVQWLLTGEFSGKALRQLTAQVLANLAVQSATLAIFELAKGFAALFLNPAEAAMHFKAAALFGVVAAGAGVAASAIAGDSFKKQTSGNAVSSGVRNDSAGGAGGRNGEGIRVYSGQKDKLIEQSINDPSGRATTERSEHTVKIGLDRGLIAEQIEENIRRNGRIRQVILEVVESA